MRRFWMFPMLGMLAAALPSLAFASTGRYASPSDDVIVEEITIPADWIDRGEAFEIALESGVDPTELVFLDLAPFPTGEGEEFTSAWAAVVMTESNELLGTFIDELTGDMLAEFEPLHEGLEHHLRVDLQVERGRTIAAQDQYENFPWGYDLPTNWGDHRLNCGYGCSDTHQGQNYYAVDMKVAYRECVPASASGYVVFAGWNTGGYGNEVIVRGMPLGGGNYYIYRVAHLDYTDLLPGWWVNKNRTLGLGGATGNATGVHVHFSVHRGYDVPGGYINGGSMPLDRWPGSNDRIDYFNRDATYQFSFNVCR